MTTLLTGRPGRWALGWLAFTVARGPETPEAPHQVSCTGSSRNPVMLPFWVPHQRPSQTGQPPVHVLVITSLNDVAL